MIRARTVIIGSILCISELSLAIEPLITEDDVFGELHLVSSVTHMQQTVEKTPAAVTIIDRRTIEASAAVDVPDLFRLIPGFRTYFVNGNQPAVTYHAFNENYPRRLEVKIDGRSVYESIYSSVQWTTLGVELNDIDYIEVVRGGNAPADGSNAFLASINIVTKSPLLDKGWSIGSQIGNDAIRNGSMSYAGSAADLNYRTTLRYVSNDGFDDFSGMYLGNLVQVPVDDSADALSFDFRGLWTPNARDSIELQFGFNDSDIGIGKRETKYRQIDYGYQHLNWSRINQDGSKRELVLYHNRFDITDDQDPLTFYQALGYIDSEDPLLGILSQLPDKLLIEPQSKALSERWDAELRQTFIARNNVRGVYGIGLRQDKVSSNTLFDLDSSATEDAHRGYLNIEWNAKDYLSFNAGIISEKKDDHSSIQSYRVASNYQLSDNQTIRLAFNQGYRAPTLLESQQSTFIRYNEDLVLDAQVFSAENIEAERLLSSEIGYIGKFLNGHLNLDLRLFRESMSGLIAEHREHYADFDELVKVRDNADYIDIQGLDWQLQYRPNAKFLLHANYSYVDITRVRLWRSTPELDIRKDAGYYPQHIGALLLNYITEDNISLSFMANHQSTVEHHTDENIKNYTRVDLKAAKNWAIKDSRLELSLTLQNIGGKYREDNFYSQFRPRGVVGLRLTF